MTEPAPIGRFSSHGEFLAVLRAQAERMGLNYQMLDAAAGFGDGYSTKVLPDRPQKNFSPRSFDAYLGALGLEFIAVENPKKVAKTKAFVESKLMKVDGPRVVRSIVRMPRPIWLFSSKRGRIAIKKRWKNVPKEQRVRMAKRLAAKRWEKHRPSKSLSSPRRCTTGRPRKSNKPPAINHNRASRRNRASPVPKT